MRHGWGLVLVLLGACTNEVTIAPNTCGNFVLEPGEDCDQPGGACTAQCRFACVREATDCTTAGNCCPGGMACGLDGSCHAPTGTLSPSEVSASFDVSEFRALDLDGDGVADVLGTGQGSVLARYGSVDAPLASLVSREAPFANGPGAFGDFTGDHHVGVLLPTTGGLFAFDTSSGAPEAIAFPTSTDPATQYWKIDDSGKVRLDLVASTTATQRAVRVTIDPAAPAQPCGTSADVDSRLVRGRGVHAYTDGTRLLVPMAILSGAMQTTVCVHASSGASVVGTLPRLTPPDGETMLVNLDVATTACPALLVPFLDVTGSGRTSIILPSGTTGSCTYPTTSGAFTPMALSIEGYPLGTIALATSKTGVITSAGVWTVDTTIPQIKQVTDSTRDWRYAVVGDFNGDGLQDFATAASGADGEAFLQRLDLGNVIGWDAFRLVTGGGVYSLGAGDFDGDGFDDVALATVDPTNDRTGAMSVAYGGPAGIGLTDPVAGPSFPEFTGFTTAALVDRSLPAGFDHSLDLIVAHGGDGLSSDDPGTLTEVFGSSERELEAPFAYDSPFGTTLAPLPAQGEAVAIGHFGGPSTAVALFGHGKTSLSGYMDSTIVPLSWQAGAGTFAAISDNAFSSTFKLTDSHVFSTAYDAGELLVVLKTAAIAAGSSCQLFYFVAPTAGTPSSGTATCATITGGAADSTLEAVTALRTIADEGTAHPKILVDQVTASKGYVATEWTLSIGGATPGLSAPIDYNAEVASALGVDGLLVGCSDATAAELGTRTKDGKTYGDGVDRVAACRVVDATTKAASVSLFARFAASDGSAPLYVPLVDTKLDLQVDVEAGDFNGDGLDDIVFTAGPPGFTSVHLYLQCDTHGGGCTAKAGS